MIVKHTLKNVISIDMDKKTVFITGGSTGIGAAAVIKFLSENWNDCLMDVK